MRTHEVSSTTHLRNEVKRRCGGLDRAKHGKPEGQKLNKVKLLAISLFRFTIFSILSQNKKKRNYISKKFFPFQQDLYHDRC